MSRLCYSVFTVLFQKMHPITGLTRFSFVSKCHGFTNIEVQKQIYLIRLFQSKSNGSGRLPFKKQTGLIAFRDSDGKGADLRQLMKPFFFTLGFSASSFVGAAIWQYENMRELASSYMRKHSWWQHVNESSYKHGDLRKQINLWWNSLSEGQKVAWGIIGTNAIVLLLWRVPKLQPILIKYFCSDPSSKAVCLPMILSVFSHHSFAHFAINMYVLYSFSTTAVALYGKEQFMAAYLSGGVISSFASYIHKIAIGKVGLSLGASGALMGILASVCFQYPDAKLAIVFLPFFTFSAGIAIKTVMAIDTAGLFLGWKLFDHAAHLGGALFGIGYLFYGQDAIWAQREPLMQWWHTIREKSK
ncbi:rhomboid family intramembrane serine protease rho-7 isoform X5 [Tachypleus tridentatus]|uniref:rhomboid family intramembrane serine protease rho-7 isoform X5 n=1 Tax=Tachypleus tridentatus TaxID=6853 RepID=UPI003FCEEBF4